MPGQPNDLRPTMCLKLKNVYEVASMLGQPSDIRRTLCLK